MKTIGFFGLLFSCFLLFSTPGKAQTIPSVEEVQYFFNDQNIMITYREGEVIYSTYYFIEIHYCPGGQYGLYGNSVKQTVLGNEQRGNWEEFGTWKVTAQDRAVGIYYVTTEGVQQFVPIYKLASGDLFVREGVTIVKQGQAICY
ncbi:MAG: hypothetical protein DRI70_04170 [Bacteroidetes bacterium]|nr:MAG: hypothetical protein DRI70_04170 [Bacteroidota bacterium]